MEIMKSSNIIFITYSNGISSGCPYNEYFRLSDVRDPKMYFRNHFWSPFYLSSSRKCRIVTSHQRGRSSCYTVQLWKVLICISKIPQFRIEALLRSPAILISKAALHRPWAHVETRKCDRGWLKSRQMPMFALYFAIQVVYVFKF